MGTMGAPTMGTCKPRPAMHWRTVTSWIRGWIALIAAKLKAFGPQDLPHLETMGSKAMEDCNPDQGCDSFCTSNDPKPQTLNPEAWPRGWTAHAMLLSTNPPVLETQWLDNPCKQR